MTRVWGIMAMARALLAAGALMLSACGDDRFPDYRYKMTVEVDTPDGVKRYSSVREIKQEEIATALASSGRRVKTTLRGEAVVMDLPGRNTPVFALLSRPDNADYAKGVAPNALRAGMAADTGPGDYLDRMAREQQAMVAVEGPRELSRFRERRGEPPADQWPMFVAFDDPADPKTVREVSPESIGVRRILVEITDEDVTTGIGGRLPWLGDYPEPSLNPAHGPRDYSLPATLTHGAFRMETKK